MGETEYRVNSTTHYPAATVSQAIETHTLSVRRRSTSPACWRG